jgi:hypothetical protein
MVYRGGEGISNALLKAGFNTGFFYDLRKAAFVQPLYPFRPTQYKNYSTAILTGRR